MYLVDLTMPVSPSMLCNPDHLAPEFVQYGGLETEGWVSSKLVLSSHTGTHVDAPAHFVDGGATVDEIPLTELVGDAQVLHLSGCGPGTQITPEQLGEIKAAKVLIHTGWYESTGHDHARFYDAYPALSGDAAQYLLDQGVHLVGTDTPSVDHPPSPIHKLLLRRPTVIVENLIGLERLPERVSLTVLPLLLSHVDGSPARAIATVLDGTHQGRHENAPQPRREGYDGTRRRIN